MNQKGHMNQYQAEPKYSLVQIYTAESRCLMYIWALYP
jgi:hypothetical protein